MDRATKEILTQLNKVHSKGKHGLSKRHLEILELFLEGVPRNALSKRLNISESTVKSHLNVIYAAYGIEGEKHGKMARLIQHLHGKQN